MNIKDLDLVTEPAPANAEVVVDPTRNHYQTLDGLRGVAALCVFLVHCFSRKIATNGFLGVDFFFMLSGFVIAAAYSRRLKAGVLTFGEFSIRRFERLWPMLLVGTLLGLFAAMIHNWTSPSNAYPSRALLQASTLSLLLVPQIGHPVIDDTAFPLNTVVWSLCFEVIANLVYAVFARWITFGSATAIALFGLVIMLILGTEGGGTLSDLYLGAPRVLFGFFSGVALWEAHDLRRLRSVPGLGLAALSGPLLLITFIPFQIHGLMFVAVALIFLCVIASGAQDRPTGALLWTCVILGSLSYPLYLVHRPLLYIVPGVLKRFTPMSGVGYDAAVVATLVTSLALSYILERYYEVPVRRWIRAWIPTKRAGQLQNETVPTLP